MVEVLMEVGGEVFEFAGVEFDGWVDEGLGMRFGGFD